MGSKLSVMSNASYRSSSSSSSTAEPNSDKTLNNMTRIPKYLKPAKPLKKQHRERLEKQQQQQQQGHTIGVAVPYQPDSQNNNNHIDGSPNPPFMFIQNGSHYTLKMQQEQEPPQQDPSTVAHGGPKDAFQWFEGRRYQNQDNSILPNDERELDRLRVLNYILRWAFEGDVVAPVKTKLLEGTHVLNVGCGPGIWLGHPVIDFALDYHKSHFTAVDVLDLLPEQDIYRTYNTATSSADYPPYSNFSPLHPMLPTTVSCSTWHQQQQQTPQDTLSLPISNDSSASSSTSTPSFSISSSSSSCSNRRPTRSIFDNLDIYTLDVREHRLPFMDNTFEFVMQRLTTPAYGVHHWQDVVRELIRVTQPGGYIQLIEIDYNAHGLGPYGQAWQDTLCTMLDKTRRLDPFMASHLDTLLKENGLVNVETKKISIPFGAWGFDIGILWQQNLEAFIEASAPAFGSALGISAADCIAGWQKYKDELKYVKAFANVYAVWGQKPEVT